MVERVQLGDPQCSIEWLDVVNQITILEILMMFAALPSIVVTGGTPVYAIL